MYRFSLNEFTGLFTDLFRLCRDKDDRVKKLILAFNSLAFSHFCRSLFRDHRLVFGMTLLKTVYPKLFPEVEWTYFIKMKSTAPASGLPEWIPSARTGAAAELQKALPELVSAFKWSGPGWKEWIAMPSPEAAQEFPGGNVSVFQRLLALAALRPDRVLAGIERMVYTQFHQPEALDLRRLLAGRDQVIVFVVTPGSDPSLELRDVSRVVANPGGLKEVALGECASSDALRLISTTSQTPGWVCIKNVHLDRAFLESLERELPTYDLHQGFRLLLTTEVMMNFPSVLLRSSAKIAYEAPPGLVPQLGRVLNQLDPQWFDNQSAVVQRGLLLLSYVQSVLQERRAYLPVGWSQYFEFTQADLSASSAIIARGTQMDVVRGLLDVMIYGSRMDSRFDRRVLETVIVDFFKENYPMKGFPLFEVREGPKLSLAKLLEALGDVGAIDDVAQLGLSCNVSATVARSLSAQIFRDFSLISQASLEEGETGGKKKKSQASISDRLKELSARFPGVVEPVTVKLREDPALDFIVVERAAAHALINTVQQDVATITGTADLASLPAKYRQTAQALQKGTVPPDWVVDHIDREVLDEWVEELFERTKALDELAKRVTNRQVLTSEKLPLFSSMRPNAFVSSILQSCVRQARVDISQLVVCATFDGQNLSGAVFSMKVADLFLQAGALRNGRVIVSPVADRDLSPVDTVFSVLKEAPSGHWLLIPVYEDFTRERLVCELLVPCEADPKPIVMASVALMFNKQ